MHFAFPPRKSSHPQIYKSRSSRMPLFRRSRLQLILTCVVGFGTIVFLFSLIKGRSKASSLGNPPVVIVTMLNNKAYSKQYIDDIKDNRSQYARKHGYATFFPDIHDYPLNDAPSSWARIPAMRHALSLYPEAKYLWFLEQNALIMNPDLTVERHLMDSDRMEAIMLRDQSIVPPNSVIKTFTHLHGDQIHLALSQDKDGLAPGSFVLRRGEWAKFFLDTWFDPLYRSYNFQKAETHALEHIVQWHPTILSKLALVPQRHLNAYSRGATKDAVYDDADFVINFAGCESASDRSCIDEAEPFSKQWRTIFNARR